jgi:L-iditol 2-dehydrogenase
MKAGVLESIEHLIVKDVPSPEPHMGEVIVRVKVCSVCGTDVRTYRYGHPSITLPHILGHEIAGEIVSVPKDVADYRVGQRVTVAPTIACGACFYCRKDQHVYCQNRSTIGYQLPGGFAEYVMVPPRGVEYGIINQIAENISFEEASLAEPLSCCLRAQRACKVSPGAVVVVIGGGPVGIIHCRLATVNNAGKVILIEKDTRRLQQVSLDAVDAVVDSGKCNPETEVAELTGGRGADVVIVACSSDEAQVQAFSLAGKGGRINLFGGLAPGRSHISIDSNLIHYREISVRGSHGSTPQDNKEALDILEKKVIDVSDLATHTFPLDSIEEAFHFKENRYGMHVGVIP